MPSYKNLIQYLLFGFAFFLPLHEKTSTVLITVVVVVLGIGLLLKKIELNGGRNKIIWALAILFLIYAGSLLFFSENAEFKFLESKLSLLAFPIIFYVHLEINKIKILKAFVLGCALAYFICLGNSIISSIVLNNGVYTFNPLRSDTRTFFEAIIFEGNNFFGKYFSILYHNSYFALFLSFSFLIVLVYRKNFTQWVFYTLVCVFPVGIIQTMSMAGFGSLMIIAFLAIIFLAKNSRLKLTFIVILFFSLIIGISSHPRLKILINDITKNELTLNPDGMDGIMLRLLSWDASLEIVKENWLFGVGIGDTQIFLNSVYKNKAYVNPLNRNLNSHNQYLQLFVECGLLGILALFYLFKLLLKSAKTSDSENKTMIISFMVLIVFNFMFESVLSRYMGISFFSFFCCLLTYSLKK